MDAIFLSASVPDPQRSPKYASTADAVAIQAAVSALVFVILGRRKLVWGGHPAITPMVSVVACDIGVSYGDCVTLYQSRHFEDRYPEDNIQFRNTVFTDPRKDQRTSLRFMREQMFSENKFTAAVFVGGMDGIVEEFELLKSVQPQTPIFPILSTGGATLEIARRTGPVSPDLKDDLDYVRLFHRSLDISPKERRYERPELQPSDIRKRLWEPPVQ